MLEHLLPADPIQVAEQIAMIDQVRDGRFIYGAGGNTIGDERRQNHFFEFLEVMKKSLDRGGVFRIPGRILRIPGAPFGCEHHAEARAEAPSAHSIAPRQPAEFPPMGRMGYRIAIGGGSSHNERGDAVLKEDVKNYRQAWTDTRATLAIRGW